MRPPHAWRTLSNESEAKIAFYGQHFRLREIFGAAFLESRLLISIALAFFNDLAGATTRRLRCY